MKNALNIRKNSILPHTVSYKYTKTIEKNVLKAVLAIEAEISQK